MKELKEGLSRGEEVAELPRPLKQKISDEILKRLKDLNVSGNVTEQRGGCNLIAFNVGRLMVMKGLIS